MNVVCEQVGLNQQVFSVVARLADMKARNEPEYRIKSYSREHEREISSCTLFDKIQYTYLMQFYNQEESWRTLGAFPIGVDEDSNTIWLLVATENTETFSGGLFRLPGMQDGRRLKPTTLQGIVALLGDRLGSRDLHCYCVPMDTVNGANDEFFSGYRLRENERRRERQVEEEESVRAQSVTLIDAKEDKDIDKYAVERAMSWLRKAINYRATDVHIEPSETGGRVRFRIDGDLEEIETGISLPDMRRAISWLKVQARVDLNAGYRPLDGKIKLARMVRKERHEIDVRFSSIPTIWGDKVVLRLLDKNRKSDLRPSEELLKVFKFDDREPNDDTSAGYRLFRTFADAVAKPSGIVLVTGPTGSGKTTTLNNSLQYLLEKTGATRNITTIEDPVEYTVVGATQIQTEPKAGLTFAGALRSILRQDPDIVLVGEIRDAETAQIAVQAALTGHMILSTLHTNDAIGCVERLEDLGISPFLIGSTVRLFQAQRLVQLLCKGDGASDHGCARPLDRDSFLSLVRDGALRVMEEELVRRFDEGGTPKARGPNGCEACKNRGYNGRRAVVELVEMNRELGKAIQERAPRNELLRIAKGSCGYRTMLDYGLDMFFAGVIDFGNVRNLFAGE